MWHLYSRRFTLDKLDGVRTSATVDVMFRMAAFSLVIIVLFVAAAVDAGSYAAGDQSDSTHDDDVSFLLIAASEQNARSLGDFLTLCALQFL
jgi:hypothetical protein